MLQAVSIFDAELFKCKIGQKLTVFLSPVAFFGVYYVSYFGILSDGNIPLLFRNYL